MLRHACCPFESIARTLRGVNVSTSHEKSSKSTAQATKSEESKSKDGVVKITASGFSPAELSVDVGDTVTFENTDSVTRNVTFDAAAVISEDVKPKEAFYHTVTSAGEHKYHDKSDGARKGVIKAK